MRTALLVLVLLAAACGASPHARVQATVTPTVSNEDQALSIRVVGLAQHEGVRLHLRSVDAKGVAFTSSAAFGANAAGVVDTAQSAPLTGSSYSGRWRMGLIVSMAAPNARAHTVYRWSTKPRRFTLTVVSRGETIASTHFTRRFAPPVVELAPTVAANGFQGVFDAAPGARHRPAVLALGGSEGGAGAPWLARQLAGHGIPTLDLGYFHAPGLPDRLVRIPLEYFRTALEWLAHRPEVDPARITVLGVSRGSEAAQLLGIHYPKLVHAVAALVPSDVAICGIAGAGRRTGCLGPAWTYRGKPVPYTEQLGNPAPTDVPAARLADGRIRGPMFLICAGRDQVWTSCPYARAIVALREAHHERTTLLEYANAGHFVGSTAVYEPGILADDFFVPDDERGREDARPRLIAFLHGP